jgi:hypothetical protein
VDVHVITNPARRMNAAEAALSAALDALVAEMPLSARTYAGAG